MSTLYFLVDCRGSTKEDRKKILKAFGIECELGYVEGRDTFIWTSEVYEKMLPSQGKLSNYFGRANEYFIADWREVCSLCEHQPEEKVRWLT